MAEHKHRPGRAVVIIEGPDGQRHAYEIGDGINTPFTFTFTRDANGHIGVSVSGLFLGGAIWTDPIPDLALREITPE